MSGAISTTLRVSPNIASNFSRSTRSTSSNRAAHAQVRQARHAMLAHAARHDAVEVREIRIDVDAPVHAG